MGRGLMVGIYRPADGSDCTANAISGKVSHAILTGAGMPEIFEARDGMPEFVVRGDYDPSAFLPERIVNGYKVAGHVYAVPKALLDSKVWTMFGGNFLYSSDSRFRKLSEGPIAIHDRVEPISST